MITNVQLRTTNHAICCSDTHTIKLCWPTLHVFTTDDSVTTKSNEIHCFCLFVTQMPPFLPVSLRRKYVLYMQGFVSKISLFSTLQLFGFFFLIVPQGLEDISELMVCFVNSAKHFEYFRARYEFKTEAKSHTTTHQGPFDVMQPTIKKQNKIKTKKFLKKNPGIKNGFLLQTIAGCRHQVLFKRWVQDVLLDVPHGKDDIILACRLHLH